MADPFGPFVVTGMDRELRIAGDAIGRCDYDFGRLRGDISVEFRPPAQMPPVPGTNQPALAFCKASIRKLLIRNDLGGRRMRSVLLHEIGHMADADTLTKAKRLELMALMKPAGVKWSPTAYRERPCEVFAEAFVRAFSDVDSTLTGYYQRRVPKVSLARYRMIVGESSLTPPDEEVEFEEEVEHDDDLKEEDVPADRLPINVVDRQVGSIAEGTRFFHPYTGVKVTTASADGDFRLVGETDDGEFRFAVVETGRLVLDQDVRALLMVKASAVSNVRVEVG